MKTSLKSPSDISATEQDKFGFSTWFREKGVGYILVAPAVILLSMFTIYPILYLIYTSMFSGNLLMKKKPFVGADNYVTLWESSDFRRVLLNTAFYSIMLVVVVIILAVLVAVWLKPKVGSRLNQFAQGAIFTPHVISLVSVSMVFLWLMDADVGVINAVLGFFGVDPFPFFTSSSTALISLVIVMVWKELGYYTLLIIAALQGIPPEIYEAAELDDTPKLVTFFRVTLPMISPTLLFTSVVATISSFKVFDTINIMTQGGPANSTNTLVYYIYEYAFKYSKIGLASAAGVVLLAFVGILTLVQFGVGQKKVHYQ